MDTYLKQYLNYLIFEKNLSKRTIFTYNDRISRFLVYLDDIEKDISQVNEDDIRDFLMFLNDELSEASINLTIVVLRSYYKFLNKDKYINNNPMLNIENLKQAKILPQVLTVEEINKIIDVIDDSKPTGYRDKTIIEFLYSTGARISELTNLELNQLSLKEGKVLLRGKGSKDRISFLGDILLNYLYNYINTYRPLLLNNKESKYVFVGPKTLKMDRSYILQLVKKYALKAGINKNISPHTFRHSFATSLLENGVDLMSVKTLLGHSDINTTQIYTHINKELLKKTYINAHPFGKKEEKE